MKVYSVFFLFVVLQLFILRSSYGQDSYIPPLFSGCFDPLISVEQQVGCTEQRLAKNVADSIVYPQKALDNKTEGVVVLRISVSDTGLVEMVEVLNSLSVACDQEAIRVAKSLPLFTPGTRNGIPIDTSLVFSVSFVLTNELRDEVLSNELLIGGWIGLSLERARVGELQGQDVRIRDESGRSTAASRLLVLEQKGKRIKRYEIIGSRLSTDVIDRMKKAEQTVSFVIKAYGTIEDRQVKAERLFILKI